MDFSSLERSADGTSRNFAATQNSVDLGHGSHDGVNLVSWDQRFFDPIKMPGRKPLVTLRDAAEYIMELLAQEEQRHGSSTART
jgi:hypothetical protein